MEWVGLDTRTKHCEDSLQYEAGCKIELSTIPNHKPQIGKRSSVSKEQVQKVQGVLEELQRRWEDAEANLMRQALDWAAIQPASRWSRECVAFETSKLQSMQSPDKPWLHIGYDSALSTYTEVEAQLKDPTDQRILGVSILVGTFPLSVPYMYIYGIGPEQEAAEKKNTETEKEATEDRNVPPGHRDVLGEIVNVGPIAASSWMTTLATLSKAVMATLGIAGLYVIAILITDEHEARVDTPAGFALSVAVWLIYLILASGGAGYASLGIPVSLLSLLKSRVATKWQVTPAGFALSVAVWLIYLILADGEAGYPLVGIPVNLILWGHTRHDHVMRVFCLLLTLFAISQFDHFYV